MNLLTKKRVKLTRSVQEDFHQITAAAGLPALSRQTGLPYSLLYNIAHNRVKTISIRDYRVIFKKEPIVELPDRKDGEYFRNMVRLWLYLNAEQTENSLYQELFHGKQGTGKTDYRIFTGEIDSVASWLESRMEEKFLAQGLDRRMIEDWSVELHNTVRKKRVSYETIKPVLAYIQNVSGIHPTYLLKQSVNRYESGSLQTVSGHVFERALSIRQEIQDYLQSEPVFNKEKLRDRILGRKKGFFPFYAVEDKLIFLRKYGGQYLKKYLGRGIGYYRKKKIKHIAEWRLSRIDADCRALIRAKPELPLAVLPEQFRKQEFAKLISAIRKVAIRQVCDSDDATLEANVFRQIERDAKRYRPSGEGLIRFDEAAHYLKMKQQAFDYMVANHSGLFKKIAIRKEQKWYIPDTWLDTLKEISGFSLIRGKYDFLASENRKRRSACYTALSAVSQRSGIAN